MRPDSNPIILRTVKLMAAVGKNVTVSIPCEDSARDPEDLSTFTAWGYIYDEGDNVILNLTPTISGSSFTVDKAVPSDTTPGWYRWEGGFTDSAGDEEERFGGPVRIVTY